MRLLLPASLLGWFTVFTGASAGAQQVPAPVLFFTDLTSGPASGNSDPTYTANGGVYVALYGNYFGAKQESSTVTLNGAECLKLVSWGTSWLWYQKIVVQLTSGCSSGNLVVTTSGGASNGMPFTVRDGSIHFVSPNGSDGGGGSFAHPWKSLARAVRSAGTKAGATVYAENGANQTTDDGEGWYAAVTLRNQWCRGTAKEPDALVAYPGASSTIGSANDTNIGIRGTDASAGGGACQGNWTFAGLTLRAVFLAAGIAGGDNWRFIGNDFSCPCPNCATAAIPTACFQTSVAENVNWLGNNMHDVGPGSPTKSTSDQYHGVYFSTDSKHLWVGWNQIYNIYGCRGIQTHSSTTSDPNSGQNQYDIHIHDNIIHDTSCDAIVLDTIDPSKGTVEVYNNVIWNAGMGPATLEGGGNWACIYVPGETKHAPLGSGNVEVYNNTLYNCGEFGGKNAPWANAQAAISNGGHDPNLNIHMQNNIIYQISNGNASFPERYWVNLRPDPVGVHGTHNLMYGTGTPSVSPQITGTINSNPGLVNTSTKLCPASCPTDLHLAGAASPAKGTGSTAPPKPSHDINGTPRPATPTIGAYE
jgi:hypothetical protein